MKARNINDEQIADLIRNASKLAYLCLPSIHDELASVLVQLRRRSKATVDVRVVVDFCEEVLRSGYGSLGALDQLKNEGILIRSVRNNRISFIIIDDLAFLLFVESRFVNSKDSNSLNALQLEKSATDNLISIFLTSTDESQTLNAASLSPMAQFSTALLEVDEISESSWAKVKGRIEENPPLRPDFQRVVSYYSTIIQYVNLSFVGANVSRTKLTIPKDLLPIIDSELSSKLDTKLDLFDRLGEKEMFEPLDQVREKLSDVREEFLVKVKLREESILKKRSKAAFVQRVNEIKKEVEQLHNALLTVFQKSINSTFSSLTSELEAFFIANPNSLKKFSKQDVDISNKSYTEMLANVEANRLVSSVKWPKAHELLSGLKVDIKFSEVSFEDLQDPDFIAAIESSNKFSIEEKNQLLETGKAVNLDSAK